MSKIIIEIVDSNVVLNIESSNLLILEYQLKDIDLDTFINDTISDLIHQAPNH